MKASEDRFVKVGLLLDYYESVLSKKQFEALDMYYNKDMSLSEIGENLGITRQGVYEILKRGEEKLFEKTILSANDFLGDFYDLSGETNVTMINGYITKEEQQQKYEKYIKSVSAEEAQKWGIKAGASDHHTGLSFNLMLFCSTISQC